MAKKKVFKTNLKVGDTVKINRTTVGVIQGFDNLLDLKTGKDHEDKEHSYVAYVDARGRADTNFVRTARLTKTKIEYVVVWTDNHSDPFTQFSSRSAAEKFAAGKRQDKDVAEVRIYRLTK